MPKKKTTIKDIANKAGVSISTVSRVLNKNTSVAEEMEQAVLAAIAELDYQPNIFAQSLASGQSKTIGVLTQEISSPFYDAIMRGIRRGLQGSGYAPLFVDGNWEPKREKKAIQLLLDRNIDGLIVLGGGSPPDFLRRVGEKVPLIMVARSVPGLEDHCMRTDDFQGAYRATQYLLELGHQHIVHITGILSRFDAADRVRGYKQALIDAGIEPNPDLIIEGNFLHQSGILAVEMLLSQRQMFTAIFAGNDQMAFGARLALYRRGIRVPDDISIVGFDDQPDSAYMIPPLTTIRQPAIEMGEKAAQTILNAIKEESFTVAALPTELIIRESAARR